MRKLKSTSVCVSQFYVDIASSTAICYSVIRMRNFYPRSLLKLSQQAWLLKESLLPGGANQFAGGSCTR